MGGFFVKKTGTGAFENFRDDPEYRPLLEATAQTWVTLIRTHSAALRGSNRKDPGRVAYERAIKILAQLPMELRSPGKRFARCRWEVVLRPGPHLGRCCEHPWTKAKTRVLVERLALRTRKDLDAVAGVAKILDARQDTVLVPVRNTETRRVGILETKSLDGFAPRYRPGLVAKRFQLLDRKTCRNIDPWALGRIENRVSSRVADAFASVGLKAP